MLTFQLLSCSSVSDLEKMIGRKDGVRFYSPLRRCFYSVWANRLAAKQVDELIEITEKAKVAACSFLCPNIVLIIGESYAKHHSSMYGYFMPTTPRQEKMMKQGNLVRFSDVVSGWNITSYVFKNMLSTYTVGDTNKWYQQPLFPALFKKAGYHVTFLSNEFVPQLREDDGVFEFNGGFFLNHPILSKYLFDERNTSMYAYDENLVKDYVSHFSKKETNHNLTIFHLIGQHIDYKQRYPQSHARYSAKDYVKYRPELTEAQRKVLAEYDNATLYNDSVVAEIISLYADKDAVVIYVPDHGEECYEGKRGFICRNHYPQLDWLKAHYEFEIPFWIYCSPKMISSKPALYHAIVEAQNKRYMTDALPHLLLCLAGIQTKWYKESCNLISSKYQENRARLLNEEINYDDLRKNTNRR